MNNQELLNLFKQGLTLAGGILTGAGILSASQSATLTNDLLIAIPAVISIASVASSVYAHWNMKKVPETATVIH